MFRFFRKGPNVQDAVQTLADLREDVLLVARELGVHLDTHVRVLKVGQLAICETFWLENEHLPAPKRQSVWAIANSVRAEGGEAQIMEMLLQTLYDHCTRESCTIDKYLATSTAALVLRDNAESVPVQPLPMVMGRVVGIQGAVLHFAMATRLALAIAINDQTLIQQVTTSLASLRRMHSHLTQ